MTNIEPQAPAAITGIHHLNLSVTNLERSAEWYEAVFGLDQGWDMPDEQGRGRKTVLLLPGSSFRLVLTQHESNDGTAGSEFSTGLDHVAFTVESRPDLDLWTDRLDTLGIQHSPVKEGATGWLITLRDPDNLQLEVYTATK